MENNKQKIYFLTVLKEVYKALISKHSLLFIGILIAFDILLIFFKNSTEIIEIFSLLEYLLTLILGLMLSYIIFENNTNNNIVTLKKAWEFVKTKIFLFIKINILKILALFGFFLLLLIPGIIFGTMWFLSSYAILFKEKKTFKEAMKYSKNLVKN